MRAPHGAARDSSAASAAGSSPRAPLDPARRPRRRSARAASRRRDAPRPARGSRRRSSRRRRARPRPGAASRRGRRAATSSSSPARTCSASAPCAASGSIVSARDAQADLVREPEPVEAAGREHDRVEPALARLAQARVDVAAQRLDRERRLEREQLRAAAHRRGADAHAGPDRVGADSASRGSSRSRYAPTARPSVSVEVMSFAECTATSMRPASSASSISLTKTPRSPIWPNGLVRSRSPAVVIGTKRDLDARPRAAPRAACSAWVSASLEPREPIRTSTGRPPSALRPAQAGRPTRTRRNADGADDRQRPLDPALVVRSYRSSSRPNRCRTASAYAAPSAPTAASFMRTVGRCRSLFRICAVTDSSVRRSSSRQRPPTFASSAARISSARARSDAIAGTTSSDACHSRNRSASSATSCSARSRPRRGGRRASRRRPPRGRRCRRGSSRRARATPGRRRAARRCR